MFSVLSMILVWAVIFNVIFSLLSHEAANYFPAMLFPLVPCRHSTTISLYRSPKSLRVCYLLELVRLFGFVGIYGGAFHPALLADPPLPDRHLGTGSFYVLPPLSSSLQNLFS